MIEVAKLLDKVARTSSYNDKLSILRVESNLIGLKDILKFIYNPYCRTGISTAKLTKALSMATGIGEISYSDIIRYLTRHPTGADADLAYAGRFVCQFENDPVAFKLAKAIVTQDLQIGITATSLNKIYGADFIPRVGCMLGTPFADVGHYKTKWPCIVTEKLDGIRRILIKEDNVIRCYSRSGHEDTGLVEIIEEAKYLPNNTVYDGELLAAGSFKDNIALRQATNSIANSGGAKHGLTFNVFDMLPVDEFMAGKSKQAAVVRKVTLGATLNDPSISILHDDWERIIMAFGIEHELKAIKSVPILGLVQTMTDVEPIVAKIWQAGGEGVMLNTVSGLYEIKRSKSLLKVKHSEEHILTVVDLQEGEGKFEDMLGALVVEYKYPGNYLGVGSGFTDAQRINIWNNPEDYIGRSVEIETFGESKNASGDVSLNCPIFKRFVGEEE